MRGPISFLSNMIGHSRKQTSSPVVMTSCYMTRYVTHTLLVQSSDLLPKRKYSGWNVSWQDVHCQYVHSMYGI